jgi:hypothetical protein
MGDADTMERWLASTDMLASVDLKREGDLRGGTELVASHSLKTEAKAPRPPSDKRGAKATAGATVDKGEIC